MAKAPAPKPPVAKAASRSDIELLKQRAIELARSEDPGISKNDKNVSAVLIPDFLGGKLVIVTDDADGAEYYVVFRQGIERVYLWSSDLAWSIAEYDRARGWWKNAVQLGALLIGVVITITLCGLSVFREKYDPPAILSNALTVILGFYFGQLSQNRSANNMSSL